MKVQQSSFANIIQDIKQDIKKLPTKIQYNSFLFYGNEVALIAEYSFSIRTALKATHDFVKFSSDDPNYLANTSNELFTNSMFGEKKAVYIENYKKTDYRKITEILEKITAKDENILILSQDSTLEPTNSIRKIYENTSHFASIGVYGETQSTIQTQVKNLLSERKINFTHDVLTTLCEIINPALIQSEILKIETFLLNKENKTLTESIVLKLISQNNDVNVFEFPAIIFARNLQKSLSIVDKLYENDDDPFPIFFAIQSYARKLYLIQNAISNGEQLEMLLKIHGVHFSQVAIVKKHLQTYNILKLIEIITTINSMERDMRFGKEFAFNSIRRFILFICNHPS